jgi:hypothetical protein
MGRCGVLRNETEWRLECEGEADSWVETATLGVAGGAGDRARAQFEPMVQQQPGETPFDTWVLMADAGVFKQPSSDANSSANRSS